MSWMGGALGTIIDGRALETRNTGIRFARLYKAITAILGRRKIAGWVVEVLVGHATFFGLVRREVLSIFIAPTSLSSDTMRSESHYGTAFGVSW